MHFFSLCTCFNEDHETISFPFCSLSRNELKFWLELLNKALQSSSKWDDLKKHCCDLTEFHDFHEPSGTYMPKKKKK